MQIVISCLRELIEKGIILSQQNQTNLSFNLNDESNLIFNPLNEESDPSLVNYLKSITLESFLRTILTGERGRLNLPFDEKQLLHHFILLSEVRIGDKTSLVISF